MRMHAIAHSLAATAGLATTSTALAQSGPTGSWGHPGMMWGTGWFMGPIMMLLFLVVVVAAVVLALRWLGGDSGAPPRPKGSSARAILEERFARGEIDEEEFRRRKQALEE